jgi:hypothetical protein
MRCREIVKKIGSLGRRHDALLTKCQEICLIW